MTSALLALFLSRLYSSFFNPIVLRRITSSLPVGNRLSALSKTISTGQKVGVIQPNMVMAKIDPPYADNVVVTDTPSCNNACLSSRVIDVYASDNTKRIAEDWSQCMGAMAATD